MMHGRLHELAVLIKRDFLTTRSFTLRSFLTPLTFPIFYLYVAGFIYGNLFRTVNFSGKDIPYPLFLTIGLITVQVYQIASLNISMYWTDRRINMLSQLKHLGYSSSTYFLSKLISSVGISIINGLIFYLFAIPAVKITGGSYILTWETILVSILALVLGALFFVSFYFIIGSIVETIGTYNLLATVLLFPIMFLSEAFYPVDGIVKGKWIYLFKLNPLSLMANTLRKSLLLGVFDLGSIVLLFFMDIVMLSLALTVFRWRYYRI